MFVQSASNPSDLEQVLRRMLPREISVRCATVVDRSALLPEQERAYLDNAVSSRRAEFSTGRLLVASQLKEFGIVGVPVRRGIMNEPIWPDGIVGSISHTSEICVVVMGRSTDISFLGVDVEFGNADVSKIESLVLSERELLDVSSLDAPDRARRVRMAFCTKESVFKAIYPVLHRFIDFPEVTIQCSDHTETFSAVSETDRELNSLLRDGCGRFRVDQSLIVSLFFQLTSPQISA